MISFFILLLLLLLSLSPLLSELRFWTSLSFDIHAPK